MSAKSERITILGTPEFKSWLTAEAANEGVSVSELVRRRVSGDASDLADAQLLGELIRTLGERTRAADAALDRGIARAESVLAELREARS